MGAWFLVASLQIQQPLLSERWIFRIIKSVFEYRAFFTRYLNFFDMKSHNEKPQQNEWLLLLFL